MARVVTTVALARQQGMTARELAGLLRAVRTTHDMPALRSMAREALLRPKGDARDTLLHAIARKMVRIEESN